MLSSSVWTAPAAVAASDVVDNVFGVVWRRTDKPVADGYVARTWMWGPFNGQPFDEPYAEGPGGLRVVQYTDKSRMEINHRVDAQHEWGVTNGLLVHELITGQMQVGDATFEQHEPASIPVAGDEYSAGPTYLDFAGLLDQAPLPAGSTVTQRLHTGGLTAIDDQLGAYGITVTEPFDATGHTIAQVFIDRLSDDSWIYDEDLGFSRAALVQNLIYVTGYPITEPYWMTVLVAGTPHLVLAQAFERRVLTYTPGNPVGWQVEAGNVGRHYYRWRYGTEPPTPAVLPTGDGLPVERHFVIGTSVQGRAIDAVRIGEGRIRIVCIGGIHTGTEMNASYVVQELAQRYADEPHLLPNDVGLIFVPLLNPDGALLGQRTNANDVDLNRNWPVNWQPSALHGSEVVSGGTHPLSEPETAALYALITALRPDVIISWHSAYAPQGAVVGNNLDAGQQLAGIFATGAGFWHLNTWDLYPISGQLTDTMQELGIPAMDIEQPGLEDTYLTQHLAGMSALLQHLAFYSAGQ